MLKMILGSFRILLLLCAIAFGALGCVHESEGVVPGISDIKSFRDIPDITESEISAIEALREKKQSFSFGKILSTEGFILPDGGYAGFSPMLCELLSELFGIPFVPEFHDPDSLLTGIENKSIDFTSEYGITPDRQSRYHMSSPIAQRALGLNYDFGGAENLMLVNELLPLAYTPIALTTANDELKPIISVLNKYIAAGGINILYGLYRNGNDRYNRNVLYNSFSNEEKSYIDNLSSKIPIVLGTDTYPVSFYNSNEGEFQGISIDVLTEITRLTGIEFEPINGKDASWGEILETLRTGEASLISDLIITEERREYFIWPQTPFFSTPYAFFSKIDYPNLELYQIGQAAVGVVGWCATRQLYNQWFPNNSNVRLYDSQDDALDALEKNEIDLFFNLGYILYYQQNYREKPGFKANYTFPVFNDTFFGLNKKEVVLCSIINKTINYINTERISNEWTNRSFDYSRMLAEEQSRHANQRTVIVAVSAITLLMLMLMLIIQLIINNKTKKNAMEAEQIMLDANPLCCKLWSSDYKLMDCNKAAIELCGFKNRQEYLKKYFDLDPEYQPDGQRSDNKRADYLKRAFEEGGSFSFEWLHVLPDGSSMPAEITLVRVKYGDAYVVAGYTRDLREQKRMIRELGEAQTITSTIFEANPQINVLFDSNFNVIGCNPAALYFMDFRTREEFISGFFERFTKSLPDIQPDGRVSIPVSERMKNAVKDGYNRVETEVNINGKIKNLLVEFIRIPYKSTFALIAYAYDMTEMRNREKELMKAREVMDVLRQEAEVASKSKSNFLSNMSHEMRTPMNAIIGMTIIGKKTDDIMQKNHALNKIGDASSHLLGVINDVLDMAKIEANKLELSPVEYNFERMLEKVLTVINFRIEEKQQRLTLNIDNDIPRFLIGDDQRLAQVITNLLSNAVKFTPEDGVIELEASLTNEADGICELRIAVTDSGIGVSPEKHEKLFSAFEQADSGTSRQYGGTGLGLAISKHIVEYMDGKIWVESQLGKGAKFIFTIKAQRSEKSPVSMLAPGVNWKNIRIMVVDDEEETREQFLKLFGQFDMNCDAASDGFEACRIIEERGAYDIYFIDWRMPGMDGIELTRKIKDTITSKPSVVIMITAMDWEQIKKEALQSGVNKCLLKPLVSSMIVDCINESLGIPDDRREDNSVKDGEFGGKNLLVAEDVEINREILIALLEDTGLSINCAENGEEALKMVKAAPDKYDIVFMDVQMPVMNGYESTRRIREFEEKQPQYLRKRIPIIALTANVFKNDIEECLAAGMDDHLGKPLDIDRVIEKLRAYLR
ncbi:MAG: response regulator [Treponema sp.]|nr:response regulator [Treponema sp.]